MIREAVWAVYEEVLHAVATDLREGAVEAALGHFAIPYAFHSCSGTTVATTRAALHRHLQEIADLIRETGITAMRYRTEEARLTARGRIEGYHVTDVERDGHPLLEPYATRMVLVERDGRWLVQERDSTVHLARLAPTAGGRQRDEQGQTR